MNVDQPTEEILLESNEDSITEPAEEDFTTVNAQLVQAQKWKRRGLGTQILNNKFLFVNRYQQGRKTQYWVNLRFINPVPQRELYIDWRWGIGALILLAIASGLLAAEYYFQLPTGFFYINSITVLLITLALISLLIMIYRFKNTLTFNTLNGNAAILSLSVNNPSKQAFQSYVATLSQCIERVQKQQGRNLLASELAEHRRLKDSKAISEQDYENAKNRILSRH